MTTATTAKRGLAKALPSGRTGWLLAGTALSDAAGTGFFIAGSAVFFNLHLGISAGHVGLAMSIAGGVGLVSSVVSGRWVDRIGARRMFVLMTLAQAGLFLCYPFIREGLSFYLLLALLGALEYGSAPAWGTLVARSVPDEQRVPTRAYLRAVYNVGFSLGSLACAGVVVIGTSAAYITLVVVNAVSFAAGAVLALMIRYSHTPPAAAEEPTTGEGAETTGRADRSGAAIRNLPFVAAAACSGILAMHVSVLFVAMPLWVVAGGDGPTWLVGALLTVNTILAVLLQVRLSQSSSTLDGTVQAARRSGWFLAAACALLMVSGVVGTVTFVGVLLAVTVLVTIAELLQSASSWGIAYAVAPEERIGDYQGVFGMSLSAQALIGPGLTVYLGVEHGPYGWLALGVIVLLAAILVGPAVRRSATKAGTLHQHASKDVTMPHEDQSQPSGVLVVIGSGVEAMRGPILRRAAAVSPLWLLSDTHHDWVADVVDGVTILDLEDDDAIRAAVDGIGRPVAGVITFVEEYVEITARIAEERGLIGMPVEGALACRDKSLTRQRMAEAGEPGPRSELASDLEHALSAAERIGFPVVLKPANLGGSLGVKRADGPEDLREAFVAATEAFAEGIPHYDAGVLVEEYLVGPEISVDSVVADGRVTPLAIARKITGPEPWFEEFGHDFHPRDDLFDDADLAAALDGAHRALGITDGVTHSEWRLTKGGPRLIEVNARLGGQLIPHAGACQGLDAVRASCELALGLPLSLSRGAATAALVRFFYPKQDVRVDRIGISGTPPEGVESYGLMAAPGEELRLPPAAYQSKYAYVHVAGATLAECADTLARFEALVDFEAQPLAPILTA